MIIKGENIYEFDEKKIFGKRNKSKFSYVYKGRNISTNQTVIVKKLNNSFRNSLDVVHRFRNETEFVFNHENIQRIIESFIYENNYYIILEYIEGIDLKIFLRKNKRVLQKDYSIIKKLFIDILNGLKVFHENGLVHGDIKPANIIISQQDNHYKATIIDFGQSRKAGKSIKFSTKYFSMLYSAPEFLLRVNTLVNQKSDIYSVGVTLYEVLTSKYPYKDSNPLKLINLQINYNIQPDKLLSPDIYKIIRKATSKYVFSRPLRFYSKTEIYLMLIKGQNKRYENVDKFIDALQLIY